jgi:hypothetical protein
MITLLPREVIQSQADGLPFFMVQPIARGVIEDTGVHPWTTLYRSAQEQELVDHVRQSFHRATNRILTAPLTELARLPLLSNPGSLELEAGPKVEPEPVPTPTPKQPRTRTRKA